jgi:hypothetical protein
VVSISVAASVLAAVAALVAACGGSSGSAATSTPGGGDATAGFQAYLTCLSKNGITIQVPSGRPSGGRPGGFPSCGVLPTDRPTGAAGGGFGGGGGLRKPDGVDDATWQKAQDACASLRPSGGPGGGNGQDNGALRAYRDCLTNHGVSVSTGVGQLSTDDPTVAAAEKACAALLPSAAPTSGGN